MKSSLIVGAVFSAGLVLSANAELRHIAFEGTVATIDDRSFQLDDTVREGVQVSGFYVYDDAQSDSNSAPDVGDYWFSSGECGITVKIGRYVFKTNPDHVSFLLEMVDRPERDNFLLRSYNNICSAPILIEHIAWQLDDPTGSAIGNDDIPLGPPVLSDFRSEFGLTVDSGELFIRAHIHRAVPIPPSIPNPPAVALREAVEISFPTVLGYFYQVQSSSDLSVWTDIGDPVLGDGEILSKFVPKTIGSATYYRATVSLSR